MSRWKHGGDDTFHVLNDVIVSIYLEDYTVFIWHTQLQMGISLWWNRFVFPSLAKASPYPLLL